MKESGTNMSIPGSDQVDILAELLDERVYQDNKWGTAFDDKNTVNDWAAYTNLYIGRATTMGATKEEQRKGLLKAAAILVAALESFDRNNGFASRHYDVAA